MSLTDFVRRETPHLTPVIIDGTIWVAVPTLTAFNAELKRLADKGIVQSYDWFQAFVTVAIVAITSLGAFRSRSYGRWKDDTKAREPAPPEPP